MGNDSKSKSAGGLVREIETRHQTEVSVDFIKESVRTMLGLADRDIESERAVIIEEIRSYLDDPSEYCQILFQTALFGKRLAEPVLAHRMLTHGMRQGTRELPASEVVRSILARTPVPK